MREARPRGRGARAPAVAGRARAADLRERLEGGLAGVAEPPDHAHERVPPDRLRPQGAQVHRRGNGEVLLRPGLQAARGLRTARPAEVAGGTFPRFAKGAAFLIMRGSSRPGRAPGPGSPSASPTAR